MILFTIWFSVACGFVIGMAVKQNSYIKQQTTQIKIQPHHKDTTMLKKSTCVNSTKPKTFQALAQREKYK